MIVDGRASVRDAGVPDEVVAESSYHLGNKAQQIDALLRGETLPVAFVDADSNVWQLTAGGSGVVVFESADDKPLDDVQGDTVDAVIRALESELGIKKKKPRKKKDDEVLLGVVEPEFPTDWPDTIADVEEDV